MNGSSESLRMAKEEVSITDESIVINLFPNPAKDKIYIESTEIINTLKVYNVSGQLMLEKSIANNNGELNIELLKSGVYFIYVQTENEMKHFQIIKE